MHAKERTQLNTTDSWLESLAMQNRHFREKDLILSEVKVGCPCAYPSRILGGMIGQRILFQCTEHAAISGSLIGGIHDAEGNGSSCSTK